MDAPEPPDPTKTAQAQAGMNRDTAMTQQQLNMVNQVTPWGNLTYDQTGMAGFRDSQGNWVETPQYTATTELTPEQQAIFEQTQDAQGNLAGLAADQSGKMRNYLNEPFSFENRDAEAWAYDLGSQRLDPRLAEQRQRTEENLVTRGIRPGSAAWDREMGRMDQSSNDAYNQLMLSGRQMAFNEALTSRNQPINELTALLSGSQVQQPQFQSTPQAGVGGVDYTGLVNQQYQAEAANHQNMMGGLFGLASAPFQMFSFGG